MIACDAFAVVLTMDLSTNLQKGNGNLVFVLADTEFYLSRLQPVKY